MSSRGKPKPLAPQNTELFQQFTDRMRACLELAAHPKDSEEWQRQAHMLTIEVHQAAARTLGAI